MTKSQISTALTVDSVTRNQFNCLHHLKSASTAVPIALADLT
jgi:hypothetical protein